MTTPRRGYALRLLVVWSLVVIPLAWGVVQTLQNTVKLFQ